MPDGGGVKKVYSILAKDWIDMPSKKGPPEVDHAAVMLKNITDIKDRLTRLETSASDTKDVGTQLMRAVDCAIESKNTQAEVARLKAEAQLNAEQQRKAAIAMAEAGKAKDAELRAAREAQDAAAREASALQAQIADLQAKVKTGLDELDAIKRRPAPAVVAPAPLPATRQEPQRVEDPAPIEARVLERDGNGSILTFLTTTGVTVRVTERDANGYIRNFVTSKGVK